MPVVAIRKRSWEEHVTHPHRSGLQYSYDDLDLVCCHGGGGVRGVRVDGTSWVGTTTTTTSTSGGSSSNKLSPRRPRARCVSMPECCHQPPPDVDLSLHALQALATAVTTSNSAELEERLAEEEGSGHDFGGSLVDGCDDDDDDDGALDVELSRRRVPEESGRRRPETADVEDAAERHRDSNCATRDASGCENDETTKSSEGEDGTGGAAGNHECDRDDDDDVFARPRSSGGEREQQCISIRSDNGPPLSASAAAGGQSGPHPKPQETMESRTDGDDDRAPPGPSENTAAQPPLSARLELEAQTGLPDVEQDQTSSTTGLHVGSGVRSPAAAAMDCSTDPKENNDSVTNASEAGEQIASVAAEEEGERDNGGVTGRRKPPDAAAAAAAGELHGLKECNAGNEPHAPQRETLASHLPSQERHGPRALAERELCDSTMPAALLSDCETPHQTALELHNVETAAVDPAKRGVVVGERSGAVRDTQVTPSTDARADAQSCSEDMDGRSLSVPEDVTSSFSSEVQNTHAYQQQDGGGCVKLDTIPEVSVTSEANSDNNNAVARNNTDTANVSDNNAAGENAITQPGQPSGRSSSSAAEASGGELSSPEGLHDNQSSDHRHVGESPAASEQEEEEVADGQGGRPPATSGGSEAPEKEEEEEDMEEEAVSHGGSGTQPPGTALDDGRSEPKEGTATVKMRMRKTSRDERERSHLDSMVLLLMKLDQLDQEIENALSTTSSQGSTPTLRRRQLMEKELGSVPGTTGTSDSTNPPPHHDVSAHPGSITPGTGAKPKSGGNSTNKEKAEIEAKEACTWLRAAGFPQYAQLYEDVQFPIDIASVTRDHDFLDRDAIEALCRRLNTLNKCALMRLEISPQRKRSEDSDEDEPCAISGRWTFQRDSKRWSRLEELEVFTSSLAGVGASFPHQDHQASAAGGGAPSLTLREGHSSESVLSDLSEQPEVGSIHSGGSSGAGREEEKNHGALATHATQALLMPVGGGGGATRASSVASMCSSSGTAGDAIEDSLSCDGLPPSPLETTTHAQLGRFTFDVKAGGTVGGACLMERGFSGDVKSTRSRAKSFLKRMESLNLFSASAATKQKKKKPSVVGVGGKLEISGPVIKEGLDDNKLRRLNCVDIVSGVDHNLNLHPGQTMTLNRNRSVSYSTQTSSGSTGSSQSEASSAGSAVSTPSPVTRARSHSTAAGSTKRGGMYLEGFDPFGPSSGAQQQASSNQQPPGPANATPPEPKSAPTPPVTTSGRTTTTVDEQNRRNNHHGNHNARNANNTRQVVEEDEEEEEEEEDGGVIFFYLPEGHKPGTFPKALQDYGSNNNETNGNSPPGVVVLRGAGRQSRRQHRRCSVGSADSRLSFYDNVPHAAEEEEDEERKLDQVLQHVSGMQRFVNAWSAAVARQDEEEEEEEDEEDEECDSDSALDSASPCPSSPLQNRLEEETEENGCCSDNDQDSTGNPLGDEEAHDQDDAGAMRERRDSGVGASLTRTNRPQKLRWPSFQSSHRPSVASAQLQIGCQSVLQMNLLQKLSLLQLTALLEKHTPTNKHGFSWAVPKFMKRIKVRDYKDRNVFGVPLQVNVQRTGQPLPQGIQQAMRYLRNQCLDQVGLFRKSGVKSRIQALRQMNEACGADGGGVNYEGQSAYDVADMLKQYFRDLPEPLLTSKLSDTFLQIYQYMPKELRLQAARAAVLLLPDESREALRTLLCLLSDVTASVADNQMTPTNLAVCLAPSLFHLNTLRRKESSSPRVMNRKQTLGKPDQRDLNENLAATHGLTHMIQECRKLFKIPEEMSRCRNSYVEQALLPLRLEELGGGGGEGAGGAAGYRRYLRDSLDALLKESKDKFKGYDSCSTPEHAELAYRKVNDGSPLRLWKATVEVPATPEEVLTRVLREQAHWDEDLLESRVAETLDERTEVYQYVRNAMAPHPARDHVVLRTWLTDLPKGACALVCTSVEHAGAPLLGVRANVLTSRYFIEPCGSNKSRLTHISRTDQRGRFPEWYNKLYGHLCAAEVVRIRDSFTASMEK